MLNFVLCVVGVLVVAFVLSYLLSATLRRSIRFYLRGIPAIANAYAYILTNRTTADLLSVSISHALNQLLKNKFILIITLTKNYSVESEKSGKRPYWNPRERR